MSESALLVVYGATGNTGKLLVKQALDAGLRVRAFVRNPAKVPADVKSNENFEVVEGDLTNTEAVSAALEGATYAVCVAGDRGASAAFIMEKMAKAVIAGMSTHGVTRFVFQAGAFSRPPGKPLSPFIKATRGVSIRAFGLKHMVHDNDKVIEALQAAKGINWVVTMPGMLKVGESKGKLKAVDKAGAGVMFTDMAAFNLEVVQTDAHDHKGIFPGY